MLLFSPPVIIPPEKPALIREAAPGIIKPGDPRFGFVGSFLPFPMSMIGSGASVAPSNLLTFLGGESVAAAGSATRTITSAALGAANSGRVIFVLCGVDDADGGSAPTSITVGGVTSTSLIEGGAGLSAAHGTSLTIRAAIVPTGTTGNIVITHPFTPNNFHTSWYSMISAGISTISSLNRSVNGNSGTSGNVSVSASLSSGASFVNPVGLLVNTADPTNSNLAWGTSTFNSLAMTKDYEGFSGSNYGSASLQTTVADASFVMSWAGGSTSGLNYVAIDGTHS